MQIVIDRPYSELVDRFFERHAGLPHELYLKEKEVVVVLDEDLLPPETLQAVALHLRYLDLFTWDLGEIDDVIFWERPGKFDALVEDFAALTRDMEYEVLAPLEARGFLLAGLIAKALHLPVLPIRKYKPFYRRFSGTKADFTNWQGEAETLFVFRRPPLLEKRVLVVDDLIETGNSLEAAVRALDVLDCEVVGAFYLCDVTTGERRAAFDFPIRAFVRPGLKLPGE